LIQLIRRTGSGHRQRADTRDNQDSRDIAHGVSPLPNAGGNPRPLMRAAAMPPAMTGDMAIT
jgi:hypothetical protein